MPPARASTKRRVVSIDECKEKCVREGVPIEEDDVL